MTSWNLFSWQIADVSGWGHMNGWGWGMAVFGFITMAAFVVFVVWAISAMARGIPAPSGSDRARNILAERYAAGEIERDEYLQRSRDLDG